MTNVLGFLAQGTADPNLLLTTVLLPFLLIFVVLWGVLNLMNIFGKNDTGRKINIVLALVMTIFAAFTDAWGIIATQLAAFTGIFTYVMFIGVFIIGVILWAIGATRNAHSVHWEKHKADLNNLKELDKQIIKVKRKYEEARFKGDTAKESVLRDTLSKLEERKEALHRELKYTSTY